MNEGSIYIYIIIKAIIAVFKFELYYNNVYSYTIKN